MIKTQWYKDAVIYQIYPRSFCDSDGDGIGDIKGIISKLDYLKDLGITAVWLSPCYKSPNDDNGYDISNYRDIMDEFGTLDDWKQMLEAMHSRGIKLVMDLVVNHSSDEHEWFKQSRLSIDNAFRNYYIWQKGKGVDGKLPPNNWKSRFGGSAWEYDQTTKEFYLHLFTKKQPDLNWDNPVVRQEVGDIVKYWLDLGVDGFRCDVITYISKVEGYPSAGNGGDKMFTHGPHIHEYLRELNKNVLSKYDCMTVGEAAGVTVEQALLYTGEDRNELDTVFQFEQTEVNSYFKVVPKKFGLRRTKKVFTRWQEGLHNKGWNSLYLENHDQPRAVSTYANDKEYREQSAKMLAAAIYFQQGTPYVYQGQEIGMTNIEFTCREDHNDIMARNMLDLFENTPSFIRNFAMKKLAKRSRDNARTPMQWDDSANAGFTVGKPWYRINKNYKQINVKQAVADEDSIYKYFQKLIALRKGNKIIIEGEYKEYSANSNKLYIYQRELNGQSLVVVCNFTDKQVKFRAPKIAHTSQQLLLCNYKHSVDYCDGLLQPYESRVYQLD